MKVTSNTVKEWIRREKVLKQAKADFKRYNDRIRGLPEGEYSFPGCPKFEVIEQEYTILDSKEMAKLDPDLVTWKAVKRKTIKK